MKTTIKRVAALAVLCGAVLSASAQVSSGVSDLVLGFRQGAGSTSLEINLGNITQFTGNTAAGISGTLSLGNLDALLTSTYGASWASDSTLNWGVAGTAGTLSAATNGQAARTLWVSDVWTTAAGTLGTQNSVAYGTAFGTSVAGTAASKISNVYNGLSGATAAQTLSGSAVALPSGGNAWLTQETTGASAFTVAGLTNTKFNNQVTRLATGTSYSASDLFSITPINAATSSSTFFGTFALATDGSLSFTGSVSAIPEPSTYAAIFGAAVLGFVAVRRRRQTALVRA